ncbi:ABC-type antimicrobial peptide transport system permease subunit [Streptomyces sp. V4I8]|uniref:hypothetical protein n=1 Tax=Streptomyces sp. V4I8 TaxID=3156469 RepID=UPI003517DC17
MLKSIDMTPRQVTVMTVTSMAVLGVIGSLLGIPLGVAGYHLVIPRMADGGWRMADASTSPCPRT